MNVYGELTRAQLENLTADPTLATASKGRMWMRTDLSTIKIDLGGTADTLAMLAATQTFSNKSYSDPITFAQVATPSSPSVGFNKIYFKSDGNAYQLNSAGTEAQIGKSSAPTIQRFTVTGTQTGWLFTVTAANATVGATYTNNANTYTVLGTIAGGTQLFMSGTGATTGGTLTKATGSGDASITFSAKVALATYTTPAGAFYLRVRLVGGGSGGASSGTGSYGTTNAGSLTAFGANLLIANGGSAPGSSTGNGGAGGSTSVASGPSIIVQVTGGSGAGGNSGNVTTVGGSGGIGGSSAFGGGGGGGADPNNGGTGTGSNAAANTGAGGGGAGGAGNVGGMQTGGGGAAGGHIDVFISSPAATYPYIIGTKGAGATAGTSGSAGGDGADGYLVVEQY
jgi:hypothetical protein